MTIQQEIKRITVGANLQDTINFEVGKKGGKHIIEKIIFADKESYLYDTIIFNIYCRDNDQVFIWKTLIDFKNLSIEYANN